VNMKLTQYMKRAIINSIMNDVPHVDYAAQAQAIMMARSIELLPPGVKAFYERGNGDWLAKMGVNPPYPGNGNERFQDVYEEFSYFTVFGIDASTLKDEDFEPLIPLARASAEQRKARRTLLERVTASVNSCSTDGVLTKRFPEFARYLPAETNLITNLMQLGWAPK